MSDNQSENSTPPTANPPMTDSDRVFINNLNGPLGHPLISKLFSGRIRMDLIDGAIHLVDDFHRGIATLMLHGSGNFMILGPSMYPPASWHHPQVKDLDSLAEEVWKHMANRPDLVSKEWESIFERKGWIRFETIKKRVVIRQT